MKRLLKGCLLLLLGAVLASGAGLSLLLHPAGMRWVTPRLNRLLQQSTGMEAETHGLRWIFPLGLHVDSLRLSGEEGTGLTLCGASFRISSRRLLHRRLHVYWLRADSVRFSGWPQTEDPRGGGGTAGSPGPLPDLQPLFERVTLKELSLPDIRILPPFRPEPVTARLHGGLENGQADLTLGLLSDAFAPLACRLRLRLREGPGSEQILQADLAVQSGPVSVRTLTELSNLPAGHRLTLADVQGEIFARRIRLETPVTLERKGSDLFLSESVLQVGEGRLRLAGKLERETVQIGAEIVTFPLDELGLTGVTDPGAAVEGRLEVTGSLQDPEVRLRMAFSGLKPEDPDLWEGPPAMLSIQADAAEGSVSTAMRLEGLPGEPVLLNLDAPLRLSLRPFEVSRPEEGPLRGSLTASTDLAGLSRLVVLDVFHRLSGRLEVDAHLDGTWAAPRLRGSARVVDGGYEHELIGLQLQEPALRLSADRDQLRLESFQAGDGRGGRLLLDGKMLRTQGEPLSFEAAVSLQDFQAVRQDELDAVVNGALRWNGGVHHSTLEGALALRPVEIRIPEKMPVTLRTLEVTERFADERSRAEIEHVSRPPRHPVALDLRLDAPDRVFVRGRGLDAEGSARLRVRGTLSDPVITGELAILRGRFLFFGKRLVITRGRALFDGTFPPDPMMDVLAELRSGGILGLLQVTGPASAPDFELDSTPPLPEDEILARLLFGRESARITPWQALTLAQAVHALRGGGSAFDLMGTTRRMLQVDQIEIRSDEEQQGQTRLAVGRYLGDRMYVELERGAETESGRARVEVELTPTLRLETQTGTDSDSGIGLRWRWDY